MTDAASISTPKSPILPGQKAKRRKPAVPQALVRETIRGIPFYYLGYKDVLRKTKTIDEIMADSGLQMLIKRYFFALLLRQLDPQKYEVFMGEVGAHLGHRNNLGLDVAVYEASQLPGEKFGFQYLDVAPKFVIEVDMKVSLDGSGIGTFAQFLDLKTQKLFEAGVERLIWVLSQSRKVVIATPGEDWLLVDWNKEIELWQGVRANIGQFLTDRGINPDIFFRPDGA